MEAVGWRKWSRGVMIAFLAGSASKLLDRPAKRRDRHAYVSICFDLNNCCSVFNSTLLRC